VPAPTSALLRLVVLAAAIAAMLSGCAASSAAPASQPTGTPTAAEATPSSPPVPPRAVFLGDSYTVGVGASDPSLRWSSLVAAAAGWEEVNLGQVGTGYLTNGKSAFPNFAEMIPTAVGADPDIVVVAGGQNDIAVGLPDETVAIGTFYRELRDALPDARLIAVGPSYPVPFGDAEVVNTAVRDAAAAVGADYVDLLNPAVLLPEYVVPDSVHVNDAGHAAIAARVDAALGL
jgi:lysophospholipase L1-like esterase